MPRCGSTSQGERRRRRGWGQWVLGLCFEIQINWFSGPMSFDANENCPLMSFVAVAAAVAETAAQNDLFVAIFLLNDLFLGCRGREVWWAEREGEQKVRRETRFIYWRRFKSIDLHNAHLSICLRVTIKFEFAFSYLNFSFNWMFSCLVELLLSRCLQLYPFLHFPLLIFAYQFDFYLLYLYRYASKPRSSCSTCK